MTDEQEHVEIAEMLKERMANDSGERTPLEVVLAEQGLLSVDECEKVETTNREREHKDLDPKAVYLVAGKVCSGRKLIELANSGQFVPFPMYRLVMREGREH